MNPYRHDRETRIRVLEELLAEARGEPVSPRRPDPPDMPLHHPPPREGGHLTFVEIAVLIFIVAASGVVLLEFMQ